MSDSTKAEAFKKLDAVSPKIGYPDKWRDYSKLALVPGPYVTNYLAAQRFETDRQLAEVGKPVEPD
jgi:predicted metalloendopeptidase